MAEAALFVGWGSVVRGRERKSIQIFQEAVQFYTQLQQKGQIDNFEPFLLYPHGGDLQGFIIIRGDRQKLAAVAASDEVQRLNLRATSVVENFGVVLAITGNEVATQLANFEQNVGDILG